MSQNLNETTVKYKVVVGARVLTEGVSKTQADILVANLPESERTSAAVIPMAGNGGQVLLG
ncbi:hypothetical protein [Stenotrophomonas phage RAS14]